MHIAIFGAASFIGTNLAMSLAKNNQLLLIDKKKEYFQNKELLNRDGIYFKEAAMDCTMEFDVLINGCDMVYHLVSTTNPSTSNLDISAELNNNISFTCTLLESCVKNKVRRVVFISSGGTVYGKVQQLPINEEHSTDPINSYGIQKLTIEKILYLYKHLHGLDYRIVRLANPFGPYQRPNGILGAATTFTYKAINNENVVVYGDGSVTRDYIFIDDAVEAIINISSNDCKHNIYNIGTGIGVSVKQLIDTIKSTLNVDMKIEYKDARSVDVPVNVLDVSRYEQEFGKIAKTTLARGIELTADYLRG